MHYMFTPDESQAKVINANGGFHLVLAPPGCGKTQILTERIRMAHNVFGVDYEDMLCLTFTNRAARGMMERIAENITDNGIENVFVGNVHRYCIRLLSNEGVIPANTAIIDDEDALSILARFTNDDEFAIASNYQRRKEYFDAMHLSQMIHQISKGYPRDIRLHPEVLTKEDVIAMQSLCSIHGKAFTPETMVDLYANADLYLDSLNQRQVALPANCYEGNMRKVLEKLRLAHHYEIYKKEHALVDFNDILLITYDALHDNIITASSEDGTTLAEKARKKWIQVDEVQDISPLQMAIIDLITDHESNEFTMMYLGDEQQSIFSFMGTKASTMNMLRERCQNNIHFLSKNHRSPKYLLDVFNTYAEKTLGIACELLPQPTHADNEKDTKQSLRMLLSGTIEEECRNVAVQAEQWLTDNPEETSAIIVQTNNDAEMVSKELTSRKTPHFKISGTDLFSTTEMKLIMAHLSACQSDTNQIAWARILQGCKAINTSYGARDFVHKMLMLGICPAELISKSYPSTRSFIECYENDTIVIFDTETTGLDVFNDDIIQLAAMKVRNGEIIGNFNVHIETERTIPAMLGSIINPIVEERKNAKIISHADAMRLFADFVGNATLLAHNANFDIHILEHNIKRYAPELYDAGSCLPRCFDSLLLARLLEPSLKIYKLKHLLEELHLEGANSHLADDDVFATKSLMDYCYAKAKVLRKEQEAFLAKESTKSIQDTLLRNYAPLFLHTKNMMWTTSEESDIAKEILFIHNALVSDSIINKVDKIEYVCGYIGEDLIDRKAYPFMISQMMRYGAEINTLKEADLCNSKRIKERIYVSTVHKAKGLEFDNVIVFDAVEGRYPGFNSKSDADIKEDARKFYVAMSRAKRRLFISVSQTFVSRYGTVFQRAITPFMKSIQQFFG